MLVSWVLSASSAWAIESTPTGAARTDYRVDSGRKLGRGISNLAFGWIDILKGIEDVGNEQNFLAAITWGPIYGAGNAIVRTAAGAYETVTFPFPNEPLVHPEFVLAER